MRSPGTARPWLAVGWGLWLCLLGAGAARAAMVEWPAHQTPQSVYALPDFGQPRTWAHEEAWLQALAGPRGASDRTLDLGAGWSVTLAASGRSRARGPGGVSLEGRARTVTSESGAPRLVWEGPVVVFHAHADGSHRALGAVRPGEDWLDWPWADEASLHQRLVALAPAHLRSLRESIPQCFRPRVVPAGFVRTGGNCRDALQRRGMHTFFSADGWHRIRQDFDARDGLTHELLLDAGARQVQSTAMQEGGLPAERGRWSVATPDRAGYDEAWAGGFEGGLPVAAGRCHGSVACAWVDDIAQELTGAAATEALTTAMAATSAPAGPLASAAAAARPSEPVDTLVVAQPFSPLLALPRQSLRPPPSPAVLSRAVALRTELLVERSRWHGPSGVRYSFDADGSMVFSDLLGWRAASLLGSCSPGEGQPVYFELREGSKREDGIRAYRGYGAGCTPQEGLIEYDGGGRVWAGAVVSSRNGVALLPVPDLDRGGAFFDTQGAAEVMQQGRLVVALSPGFVHFPEPEPRPVTWVLPAAEGGEQLLTEGGWVWAGPRSGAWPAGQGRWRDPSGTVEVAGRVADGVTGLDTLVLKAPVQVRLLQAMPAGSGTVAPLPPGEYLHAGDFDLSEVRIEGPAGAAPAPRPPSCPLATDDPLPGWTPWWPSCRRWSAAGMEVLSVDVHQPETRSVQVLSWRMLDGVPVQPLATQWVDLASGRRWVANAFGPGLEPQPQGEALEVAESGEIIWRGAFAGREPDGLGQCATPGGVLIEPCEYRVGQRVDAVHQARLALAAAERERVETERQLAAERAQRAEAERQQILAQQQAEERALIERQRAQARAEQSRTNQAIAGALLGALGTVGNAYVATKQAELASLTARNQAALAAQRAQTQAQERARESAARQAQQQRQQAAQNQLAQAQAHAQAALRQRQEAAERQAAADRARLAAQTAAVNRQLANPGGGYVSPFETGAGRTAASPAPPVSGSRDSAEYRPSLEGVVICELGDAGTFRCTTTIPSTVGGGPNAGSGWRTPEEAASRHGGCREPRRIPWRPGYEVFGCGTGVTGASNYVDVADRLGVTVPGRRTFWCKPLEIGCNRTAKP